MGAYDTEFQELFVATFREAADSLFGTTEPRFVRSDEESTDWHSAGMVTFFGPHVRGMFIVSVEGGVKDQRQSELHSDWLGELANQLAGRVKSIVTRMWGTTYVITPPLELHGLHLSAATEGAQSWSTYSTSNGLCRVWALMTVHNPLPAPAPLVAEEAEPEDSLLEGDFLLF